MNYFTIGIVLFTFSIATLFVFYRRAIVTTQVLVNLGFFLGLTLVIAALFEPSVYTSFTRQYFEESFLGVQLRYADRTINSIQDIPESVASTINDLLGDNSKEAVEFSIALYDNVIDFVALTFRIITLVFAIFLLLICTYMRYAFAGLTDSRRLQKRIDRLEKQLLELRAAGQVETDV